MFLDNIDQRYFGGLIKHKMVLCFSVCWEPLLRFLVLGHISPGQCT